MYLIYLLIHAQKKKKKKKREIYAADKVFPCVQIRLRVGQIGFIRVKFLKYFNQIQSNYIFEIDFD